MITDVNNSVIMTSTVAGYANKARRGGIKGVVADGGRGGGTREREMQAKCIAGCEMRENKVRRSAMERSVYRDDRKNSHAVKSSYKRKRRAR